MTDSHAVLISEIASLRESNANMKVWFRQWLVGLLKKQKKDLQFCREKIDSIQIWRMQCANQLEANSPKWLQTLDDKHTQQSELKARIRGIQFVLDRLPGEL